MGPSSYRGRTFWGQTEAEERRQHLGLPPLTPQTSLCLGCDLGDWFLREEKAEWALTSLGLWGTGRGLPGAPLPRVIQGVQWSSLFHLKAQKIGLRLPGCSCPVAGGGINLSKCCQISRLNPVKSWAGGAAQKDPMAPL